MLTSPERQDGGGGGAPPSGCVCVPAVCPERPLQLRGAQAPRRPLCRPPGGELCHEGPIHLRQGQIPGPRLQVQFMQPAGVRGPGMQFILLQEVLPPLCPGEHGRLPSGNPTRLGEKESSIKEAGQPAWLSDMSVARCQVGSSTSHRAPGPPRPLQPGSGKGLSWELSRSALFRDRQEQRVQLE